MDEAASPQRVAGAQQSITALNGHISAIMTALEMVHRKLEAAKNAVTVKMHPFKINGLVRGVEDCVPYVMAVSEECEELSDYVDGMLDGE